LKPLSTRPEKEKEEKEERGEVLTRPLWIPIMTSFLGEEMKIFRAEIEKKGRRKEW
jgi:hypothetical protein